MADNLLEIKGLTTKFNLEDGVLTAVDHVSFEVERKTTIGVVGESGCGKSVTAFSVLRLIRPPGKITEGEIWFDGENLLKKTNREMRQIRGKKISIIFQEPMTSLNPVFTVGNQIEEVLKLHMGISGEEAKKRTIELLRQVKIPLPEQRYKEYPHQMSGGMRQRVMIAMALACSPQLLICDEPTTALDVTVQAQILRLINDLKEKNDTTVMIITHDLAVISEVADKIIVMYAGRIVEECNGQEIFTDPLHPYTEALLKSIPSDAHRGEKLYTIEGMVPNLLKEQKGCLFAPRCEYAKPECFETEPELVRVNERRKVRCHLRGGDPVQGQEGME
ncbi:MAG: ABC transporter ATP-binding protein [Clostridia bacterium]|nr:ABC transporter ATP-binding protein [Clostridia bacterium]